jgi:hypothetical protein
MTTYYEALEWGMRKEAFPAIRPALSNAYASLRGSLRNAPKIGATAKEQWRNILSNKTLKRNYMRSLVRARRAKNAVMYKAPGYILAGDKNNRILGAVSRGMNFVDNELLEQGRSTWMPGHKALRKGISSAPGVVLRQNMLPDIMQEYGGLQEYLKKNKYDIRSLKRVLSRLRDAGASEGKVPPLWMRPIKMQGTYHTPKLTNELKSQISKGFANTMLNAEKGHGLFVNSGADDPAFNIAENLVQGHKGKINITDDIANTDSIIPFQFTHNDRLFSGNTYALLRNAGGGDAFMLGSSVPGAGGRHALLGQASLLRQAGQSKQPIATTLMADIGDQMLRGSKDWHLVGTGEGGWFDPVGRPVTVPKMVLVNTAGLKSGLKDKMNLLAPNMLSDYVPASKTTDYSSLLAKIKENTKHVKDMKNVLSKLPKAFEAFGTGGLKLEFDNAPKEAIQGAYREYLTTLQRRAQRSNPRRFDAWYDHVELPRNRYDEIKELFGRKPVFEF